MLRVARWFINGGKIIFGGFVRDLLLLQNQMNLFVKNHPGEDFWNPAIGNLKERLILPKDIDVFYGKKKTYRISESLRTSNMHSKGFAFFLGEEVFRPERLDYPQNYMNVFTIKAILTNSELLTEESISCGIDVVTSDLPPPFNKPDMECNMFCLTRNGLELMTSTGTSLDTMSPFQKEFERCRILSKMMEQTTIMYPFQHLPDNPFKPFRIKERCLRVKRVIRTLLKGWTIENLKDFSLVENPYKLTTSSQISEGGFVCLICQDSERHPELQLNCCNSLIHVVCLEQYAADQFAERIHLRCPYGCAKRDTHWDII